MCDAFVWEFCRLTHSNGDNAVPDVKNTVDLELHIGIRDTDSVENTRDVITDETVARPLREETCGDQDDEPVAVALGLEDLEPTSLLQLLLNSDGLLDFLELQLHHLVVDVSLSVDMGKDGQSLLVLALGHVETGRFGNKPHTGDLDERRHSLDDGRNAPGPLAVDVVGAICEPGGDDRSDIPAFLLVEMAIKYRVYNLPSRVVDSGEDSTVLWVADFGNQKRGGSVGNGNSQTEEETSSDKHLEVD